MHKIKRKNTHNRKREKYFKDGANILENIYHNEKEILQYKEI